MYTVEKGVEPVHVELPDGGNMHVHATYLDGVAPTEDRAPFDLPAPIPAFGPVRVTTAFGPLALFFVTRPRTVAEGPRRTSLTETVHLANGRFQAELVPKGVPLADAPPWNFAMRGTGVPVSVKLVSTFLWSATGTGRGGLKIEHVREDGVDAPLLMSADFLQGWQAATEKSFRAFMGANPGLANVLERGLAEMDARIMQFEAERLRRVADIEASQLEQGAEFILDGLQAAEETSGSTFTY